MARYGQAFKDRAVARLLPPESASVETVSREIGVGVGQSHVGRRELMLAFSAVYWGGQDSDCFRPALRFDRWLL